MNNKKTLEEFGNLYLKNGKRSIMLSITHNFHTDLYAYLDI
jgi:hypothetical protein